MNKNNKRIARNTILLYFRMLLTMGVSLYTVRVVLDALGTVDYGLYNVIGGVVTMFSFLSNTMANASQRFFAYDIGQKNYEQLKRTFSATMMIYIVTAIIILILSETVGLWLLKNKLNIPPERMEAATWVYHFSVLSFITTIISIPYNAVIIAHERMNIYAYVSILEVLLKLLIVYILVVISLDKLKLYSILTFIVTSIITFIYRMYCQKNFKECKLQFFWDKKIIKEITTYSGWNIFGSLAGTLNNQVADILLNIFFGPTINASKAVASRINSSISQFVLNFMTATRPQITKYYANGERDEMLRLIFQSSKFSYMLLFIIAMPFLLEANFIISVWLSATPIYIVLFSKLAIIGTLIDSLSYSLMTAAQATGKVKVYQIIVGSMMLVSLPIGYALLIIGYPPTIILYVSIVVSVICLFLRLLLLKNMIGLDILEYTKKVIARTSIVSITAYFIPVLLQNYLNYGFVRFLIISTISLLCSVTSIYFLGLDKYDREILIQFAKRKRNDKNNIKRSTTLINL